MTSELDLHAMKDLPYGEAAKIIREKVDPLWGLGIDGSDVEEYTVKYDKEESVVYSGEITVKALNKEQALKIAKVMVNQKDFDHSGDDEAVYCDDEYQVFF